MHRTVTVWTLVLFFFAGMHEAAAQGRSRGRGPQTEKTSLAPSSPTGSGFGKEEVRIIREWFSSPANLNGLPPGLAKREQLPPGLQRQLARNGTLPPGLQKKVQPLPRDLEIKLPRLPDGRRRIIVAGNVILLEERTALIVDIIQDILHSR
jgi:hypothetical protein